MLEQVGGAFITDRPTWSAIEDKFDDQTRSSVPLTSQDGFAVELADALHHINEMATPKGIDDLLEAI